ncbi:hypothetical protein NADFUDRAFT_50175 [Nadsonia fulvescens var. elongata DSM 6958]|uniref:Thioredoxin domain-containing protein n=1 Tax=Nadsonia fulvescens var. elongata DSM 6958 TaxID=857566 RepID=A0A1E3PM37_9ASCO|nr:hypothetical protein NADFUDRAFT_50175 [Nadsonia fulvescens var. elongata DSM 6958]
MFQTIPRAQLVTGTAFALMGGIIATSAIRQFWFRPQVTYPLENRVYFPVRYEHEFDPLLPLPLPLLVNFTVRNDPVSNKLTGALHRIVTKETEKCCRLVDVEADEPTMRDIMLKYQINNIPTIMAINGGLPKSYYVPTEFKNNHEAEVDWEKLKAWVEEVAIERPKTEK